MKQANKSFRSFIKEAFIAGANQTNPRIHNIRPCPSCGEFIYGMPGGRDALCRNCGYKDPCCGD